MENTSYKKFGLMLVVSFVIMYGVMFLNADILEHVMLSNTRTYMTILMVAPMSISMMLFMWGMYKNKKLNYIILFSAVIIFGATLFALRNQTLIGDVQWMKAMIPHHSSAIMVSEKAHIKDPDVKKLAEDIIEAQKREIAQMEEMIARLQKESN